MKTLSALALAATCSAAGAQTPATNPMPDGSRDMYVGLGAVSAPRYEGADSRKVSALPVLQVQWSNGFFISGMSAGMHLSASPSVEFGPLVALQLRRTETGSGRGVDGVGVAAPGFLAGATQEQARGGAPLAGMDVIGTRFLGGAFFNYYVAPQWRLTSSALYGAGNERNGGLLDLGAQRLASPLGQRQTLSLSAGVTLANRDYNQAFFGISRDEALRSARTPYAAGGGLKDVHVGTRWNWTFTPSWMLTTNLQATRLLGSAKNSPLVERPTNLTVSTAIAYRF
jgi:outer membrane scaffolding protein for murein synthesis (MipA/OmpV family)